MDPIIRRVEPDDWESLRTIRLAALAEAPYAFGSTYAREAAFGEADWRRRLTGPGVTFLACLPDRLDAPVGLSGGYPEDEETVELVSMWVEPGVRGKGIGAPLVEAVVDWARQRGALRVHLLVTETNPSARRLYERTGFDYTEEREPMPSDPRLIGLGMVRPVVARA